MELIRSGPLSTGDASWTTSIISTSSLLECLLAFWFSFNSVQFSHSVVSDSSRPHGLQHTRPPCPSPTPGVYSNSSPLSRWCHPTISSSVIPFSSHLQSFPASGSFQMSQFFTSGGQSIGSFSFTISPSNEYSGLISFRMDWLDLLAVQRTLKSLLQHYSWKYFKKNIQNHFTHVLHWETVLFRRHFICSSLSIF